MVKGNILLSIDSEVLKKARHQLKGRIGKVCEKALMQELEMVHTDEVALLQELIDTRRSVETILQMQDGRKIVLDAIKEVKVKEPKAPETLQEKISFWRKVKRIVTIKALKGRV